MSNQPEDAGSSRADDVYAAPRTPRWVQVFGLAALLVTALVVALLVLGGGPGEHGPGRHVSEGDSGASGASSPVADREDRPTPVKGAPKPTLTVRRHATGAARYDAPVADVASHPGGLSGWDGRT